MQNVDRRCDGDASPTVATLVAVVLLLFFQPSYAQPQQSSARTYYSGRYLPTADQIHQACKVRGPNGVDGAIYRKDRLDWFCRAGDTAFPMGGKNLCWNILGRYSNDRSAQNIHAATKELPDGKAALVCLFAPVLLDCVTPTAQIPDWGRPKFASPQDDRCDTWRRGPQQAAPSSSPTPSDKNMFLEMSKEYGPYLRYQLPRRAYMPVRSAFWNADGESAGPVPTVRLEALIKGRPTIAVLWEPGCAPCDRAITSLYAGVKSLGPNITDHHDARLVILLRFADASATSRLLEDLWQKYPGATVWPVEEEISYTGLHAPYIHVFDRHGFLRTIMSGNELWQDADAWSLLDEPSTLLDLSLRDAVWRSPPRQSSFGEAVSQVRAGRMPLTVAEAPDVLTLPLEIVGTIDSILKSSEAHQREFGSYIMVDNTKVWLSPTRKGNEQSIMLDPSELAPLVAVAGTKNIVKSVGTFHTHPGVGIFSRADLLSRQDEVKLLGIVGGSIMVALPTYERLRTLRPANAGLVDPRFYASEVDKFSSNFYNLATFAAAPVVAGSLSAKSVVLDDWIANAKPNSDRIADAQTGVQLAHRKGIALYIGSAKDGRLRKIDVGANLNIQPSWTGNNGIDRRGKETGLTRADRVIISGILRAIQGDKDAFCRVWPQDIATDEWSKDVTSAIRALPAVHGVLFPSAPPMQVADSGFLNDADMLTMLEIATRFIEMDEGSFVHRGNRQCVLNTMKISEARMGIQLGRAIVEGSGDEGQRARKLRANTEGGEGYSLVFDADAVRFGCANVAVIRGKSDGRSVVCDRIIGK